MNSIAPTDVPAASRPRWATALLLGLLAACAHQPARTPPVARHAPTPSPLPRAAPPVAPTFEGEAILPGKQRLKHTLAAQAGTALAAADVGYYLDVLQGRLLQDGRGGYRVSRRGDSLVLSLDETQARTAFAAIARTLVEYRKLFVVVRVAPGDQMPARASAVARQLTAAGVSRNRIAISLPSQLPGAGAPEAADSAVELQLEPIVFGS